MAKPRGEWFWRNLNEIYFGVLVAVALFGAVSSLFSNRFGRFIHSYLGYLTGYALLWGTESVSIRAYHWIRINRPEWLQDFQLFWEAYPLNKAMLIAGGVSVAAIWFVAVYTIFRITSWI